MGRQQGPVICVVRTGKKSSLSTAGSPSYSSIRNAVLRDMLYDTAP